jgi:hypothetical protein
MNHEGSRYPRDASPGSPIVIADRAAFWEQKMWVNGYWLAEHSVPQGLKSPCPFCGESRVRIAGQDEGGNVFISYYVTCEACSASGPWTCSPAEALRSWKGLRRPKCRRKRILPR